MTGNSGRYDSSENLSVRFFPNSVGSPPTVHSCTVLPSQASCPDRDQSLFSIALGFVAGLRRIQKVIGAVGCGVRGAMEQGSQLRPPTMQNSWRPR